MVGGGFAFKFQWLFDFLVAYGSVLFALAFLFGDWASKYIVRFIGK